MKANTRDNLIYLAVGVTIAGLVVGLDFYAESHGKPSLRLSKFTVRAVGSLLLVGYFALREARRRVNATLAEMVMCALAGGVLNLAVIFGFRQTVGQISGIQYMAFASLETFLIVELVTRVVLYFRWLRHA
jgi:hypothetical protein